VKCKRSQPKDGDLDFVGIAYKTRRGQKPKQLVVVYKENDSLLYFFVEKEMLNSKHSVFNKFLYDYMNPYQLCHRVYQHNPKTDRTAVMIKNNQWFISSIVGFVDQTRTHVYVSYIGFERKFSKDDADCILAVKNVPSQLIENFLNIGTVQ